MEAVPNVAKADGQLTVEQSRWSAERSTDGITRVPLSLFTIWHERTCEEFDTTGQFAVFLTAHVGGTDVDGDREQAEEVRQWIRPTGETTIKITTQRQVPPGCVGNPVWSRKKEGKVQVKVLKTLESFLGMNLGMDQYG